MSRRAFSRSFDMPTVDPDKEDETPEKGEFEKQTDRMIGEWLDETFAHIDVEKYVGPKVLSKLRNKDCPAIPKEKKGCDHKWKSYLGLSEQFYFCTECDEKKDMK